MNPLKINDTTYELTLPLGDRVEIGDKDSADFRPCARLNRWGTECSLVLTIPTTEKILPAIQGERILWQGRDCGAEFFAATDGFKFNIILPRRPETNVFPLDFGSANLKFYYQPPLTEEFKEGWSEEFQTEIKVTETQVTDLDGNVLVNRPENVIGSYAVYHATKGNMHPSQAEAEKYKTGKAFHWYRPLIYDSAGKTTWGILNVDPQAGIRTVTIPHEFLNEAVYPVTIDDEFGYTSAGQTAGGYLSPTYIWAGYPFAPASSGVTTSISACLSGNNSANVQFGLYTDGSTSNKVDYTGSITPGSSKQFYSANTTGAGVTGNTNYDLCMIVSTSWAVTWYYDSGKTGFYTERVSGQTFGTWPSSITWSDRPYSSNAEISIYCTYTPGGGGATEKFGADTGTGADARASGNPLAAVNGSYKVYLGGVAVARNLPAAEMALGRRVAVIFFDEHNAKDAVVIAVYT